MGEMVGEVPDELVGGKATWNGGGLKVWRMHRYWIDCYNYNHAGDYKGWKLTLDTIYNELLPGRMERLGRKKKANVKEDDTFISVIRKVNRTMFQFSEHIRRKQRHGIGKASDDAYNALWEYEQALRIEADMQGLDYKRSRQFDLTAGF